METIERLIVADIKGAMETYKRNERINAHSENLVLLANMFGTEEQINLANELVGLRDTQGYLSMEQMRRGYTIQEQLYPVFYDCYKKLHLGVKK